MTTKFSRKKKPKRPLYHPGIQHHFERVFTHARKTANLSIDDVAERAKLSRITIYRALRQPTKMKVETLTAISKAVGVEPGAFWYRGQEDGTPLAWTPVEPKHTVVGAPDDDDFEGSEEEDLARAEAEATAKALAAMPKKKKKFVGVDASDIRVGKL